jgi:hypothetical protein
LPFFQPHLPSKFVKNANIIQKIKNAIRVSKNAEFYADFESVENVAKSLCRKVIKKKIGVFTFITVCKRFRPITF